MKYRIFFTIFFIILLCPSSLAFWSDSYNSNPVTGYIKRTSDGIPTGLYYNPQVYPGQAASCSGGFATSNMTVQSGQTYYMGFSTGSGYDGTSSLNGGAVVQDANSQPVFKFYSNKGAPNMVEPNITWNPQWVEEWLYWSHDATGNFRAQDVEYVKFSAPITTTLSFSCNTTSGSTGLRVGGKFAPNGLIGTQYLTGLGWVAAWLYSSGITDNSAPQSAVVCEPSPTTTEIPNIVHLYLNSTIYGDYYASVFKMDNNGNPTPIQINSKLLSPDGVHFEYYYPSNRQSYVFGNINDTGSYFLAITNSIGEYVTGCSFTISSAVFTPPQILYNDVLASVINSTVIKATQATNASTVSNGDDAQQSNFIYQGFEILYSPVIANIPAVDFWAMVGIFMMPVYTYVQLKIRRRG